MAEPAITLYSIPPSHPARAARLMLDYKGLAYRLVQMPTGTQRAQLWARRFPRRTVPALRVDGRRVQGTREIARELDALKPEPPLFPADPQLRARVEEAERWGEETYQPIPRMAFRWALKRDRRLRRHFAIEARLPAPGLAAWLSKPLAAYFARLSRADDGAVRERLAGLPAQLDRVDALIADGTLGGEQLNAADFQIGTTTRVLLNFPQLRPLIEGRPAAAHAMRVSPRFGREVPIELPAEWIPR